LSLTLALFIFRFLHDRELQYPYSVTNFSDTGDYDINPHTILIDLKQSKRAAFIPIDKDPTEVNNAYVNDAFSWQQSDYLRVADALQQFVWNDSLDDWKIFGMVFWRRCRDDLIGFDSADITFYKYNNQGGYKVREMDIYPSGGGVSVGAADNWPRPLFGWENIELSLLKVTADDALRIAEENGGKEFRVIYQNECDILLVLKPNPSNMDDWSVYYNYQGNSKSFEIQINPFTGWH
jgi:hypothetical protein